jgi:hypothetical protein
MIDYKLYICNKAKSGECDNKIDCEHYYKHELIIDDGIDWCHIGSCDEHGHVSCTEDIPKPIIFLSEEEVEL